MSLNRQKRNFAMLKNNNPQVPESTPPTPPSCGQLPNTPLPGFTLGWAGDGSCTEPLSAEGWTWWWCNSWWCGATSTPKRDCSGGRSVPGLETCFLLLLQQVREAATLPKPQAFPVLLFPSSFCLSTQWALRCRVPAAAGLWCGLGPWGSKYSGSH